VSIAHDDADGRLVDIVDLVAVNGEAIEHERRNARIASVTRVEYARHRCPRDQSRLQHTGALDGHVTRSEIKRGVKSRRAVRQFHYAAVLSGVVNCRLQCCAIVSHPVEHGAVVPSLDAIHI
jgi:hypothetical protein